jgi:hypothetical protein
MIAIPHPTPLDVWRSRFGGERRHVRLPRWAAALGYLANGLVIDGLVEIGKLTLVILYADRIRRGQDAVRLAGFSGSPVPWGVRWGGASQCRFSKDLLLQPVLGGPGLRLNAADTDLLRVGLALERELDRHARNPRLPLWRRMQLPKLWAAFRQADVATITGDGPELACYARQVRRSADNLLADARRVHGDTVLYPFPWVSHHWHEAVTIFADLERFPQRQVFGVRRLPDDLSGFQAAAEYDFRSPLPVPARHRPFRRDRAVLACA